jgi:hypothetical protein
MKRILAGLALALLIASPVLGAKPPSAGSATCSITPDPVAQGAVWTVNASGLPLGDLVNGVPQGTEVQVRIDNGIGGTGWAFRTPDGTYTYSTNAPWGGTSITVQFQYLKGGGNPTILAECSAGLAEPFAA